jgi:ABC-type transport system involved in cytochrome c biogenesis permease component
MKLNWRAIRAIVRKDLRVVIQHKGVSIPLVMVPLIIFVVLPLLIGWLPAQFGSAAAATDDYAELLAMVSPRLADELARYDPVQAGIVFVLVYMLAPLFLIVPMMVANVIAADSFVGERERKTLEALLYTPTTDSELMLGKLLAAWLPALAVAFGGFVVYGVVANLAAWPVMGQIFFPNFMWLILVFWVAPAAAGLGLLAMLIVSARARTFQEAYQLGSLIVLPVIFLLVGQLSGLFYFSPFVVFLLGLALWLVDAALLWFGIHTLRRDELIARL